MSGFGSTRLGWLLGIAIGGIFSFWANCALAQITPDGTLPNNSIVTPDGSILNITGGTQAGGNLFHSFKEFSVPTGGTAFFNNAVDIQNIISRVTGGSVSNIDGLIRALGTANLFLINPNGIIFGQGASLNIGGSFLATTASAVKFADGFEFSATAPQTAPLLTVSVPIGLQYGGNPGRILNQSQARNSSGQSVGLQVEPGKTLALVGGEVSLNGAKMLAPNGRVELGAIAGIGTVGLNLTGNQLNLSVPDNVPRANVSLMNAASVDVTDKGQGSVAITANNLNILGGSRIAAGIGQGLTAGSERSGDITLNATGVVKINQLSRVTNVVGIGATGDAGDIIIKSGNTNINNQANVPTLEADSPAVLAALDTGSMGQGRAGNVSLFATDSIALIGQDANFEDRVINTSGSYGRPGGGNITLKANGSISLSNAYLKAATGNGGGNISLLGNDSVSITANSFLNAGTTQGNSGSITVESRGPISIIRSRLSNNVGGEQAGNAGEIEISGRSVSFTQGTLVEASAQKDSGNSGNIRINAIDKVEISDNDPFHGRSSDRTPDTEITLDAENTRLTTRAIEAKGNAGDITITAGEIFIKNQASVPNRDRDMPRAIETASDGEGSPGNVLLEATGSITIIGQDANGLDRTIRTSNPNGRPGGGNITLKADGLILLKTALLHAPTGKQGSEEAHKISLFGKDSVSIVDNSFLNIGAEQGSSGSIIIESLGPITIQRSSLGNNVDSASGTAGDLTINGHSVYITDGSLLEAKSESGGINSGNIQINAVDKVVVSGIDPLLQEDLLPSLRSSNYPYTTVTTNTESEAGGQAGSIIINSSTLIVSDGASLRAQSRGTSKTGNIFVNARQMELTNGGKLLTNSIGSGDAGDINIKASDRIVIDGINPKYSDLFAQVVQRRGRDEAEKYVGPASSASGVFASTASGQGGNIRIDAQNLLLLRHNGQISATAGTELAGGDGGNITINAPNGFIVAIPDENSDITANAFSGKGGNIRINAQSIFGIQPRPQLTPKSDITASSQLGIQGQIDINQPDVELSRGLINLPSVPVDTEVAQSCTAGGTQAQSNFIITGRGGLPPNPGEALTTDAVQVNLVTLNPSRDRHNSSNVSKKSTTPTSEPIVEATEWVLNEKGEVVLTANLPTTTPRSPWFKPVSCRAS